MSNPFNRISPEDLKVDPKQIILLPYIRYMFKIRNPDYVDNYSFDIS